MTPYEAFYGTKPDFNNVRVFGTLAMVHIPKETRPAAVKKNNSLLTTNERGHTDIKLTPQAAEYVFIKYIARQVTNFYTSQQIILFIHAILIGLSW